MYNLKNNPELARQRHNEQARAWYRRNKEYVIARQREYRLEKRRFKDMVDEARKAIKQITEETK